MRFWRRLLWITVGILFTVGIAPILKMVTVSLTAWMTQGVSFETVIDASLLQTLLFAAAVALVATTLGMLLAFLFAKTDLPFAPLWMTLLSLPLLLPSDIVALGWIDLLLPYDRAMRYLESYIGAGWIEVTLFMPIAMLLCYHFLRTIPYTVESAALLYVDERTMLRTIDLPLIRPALALSFLIIFLLAPGNYAVPNALHLKLYTIDLFTRFSAFYDFEGTLLMSLPLLLVAVVAIGIEHTAMRHAHFKNIPRFSYRIGLYPATRKVLSIGVATVAALTTLLPLAGIVSAIDTATHFLQGLMQIKEPLLYAFGYAVSGGILLTLFGTIAALAFHFYPSRLSRYSEEAMLFFFILPSIVIAVALIGLYNTAWTDWIYASPLMLLFAYLAKYLILPVKTIRITLAQLPRSLSEAAMIHGATPAQTLRHILLPLLRNSMIVALLIGTLFCLRESTMAMLLLPPGEATLPVYLATHAANGESGLIAAMALWMVIVTSLVVGLLMLFVLRFSRSATVKFDNNQLETGLQSRTMRG